MDSNIRAESLAVWRSTFIWRYLFKPTRKENNEAMASATVKD